MKPDTKSVPWTVALMAVLVLAAQPCAAANTWTVTSTADDGSDGTLRHALLNSLGGDTINFAVTGTILLAPYMGPLVVDKNLTIVGPGQDQLTIDGGFALPPVGEVAPMNGSGGSGVFWVGFDAGELFPDVTVSMSGVTIAHGGAPGGGGILNAGQLTLSACTLRDNVGEYGGAIANLGTVELTDCTLANNLAFYFGGAIFNGDVVASGATPTVTVTGCILSDNIATSAGAQWGDSPYGGGAIANLGLAGTAVVTIEDSVLTGNSAQAGGAINNQSIGDGYVDPPIPGFAVVTIVRSTLSGNSAAAAEMAMGGAIYQAASDSPVCYATVTLESSTLDGNSAISPAVSFGGGICDFSTGVGSVILRNSTLANNSARFTEGSPPEGQQSAIGGAIVGIGSTLYTDNCTLSGNFDVGSQLETTRVSGILVVNGASLTIKNTLLANDASGSNVLAAPDSTVTDLGYNLSTDDGSGLLIAAGNQLNTNPLLGPLADNGGATWTCALLPGSPAIDAADSLDSNGDLVTQDQRGVSRPQGAANDVGAFESVPLVSALDFSGATATAPSAKSPNITVTVIITNPGDATAYNVTVTAAKLGGVDTKSPLPLVYGAIKPGTSKKCTLQFKDVPTGDQTLTVNGTSSLGAFFTTQMVPAP